MDVKKTNEGRRKLCLSSPFFFVNSHEMTDYTYLNAYAYKYIRHTTVHIVPTCASRLEPQSKKKGFSSNLKFADVEKKVGALT